MNKTNNQALKEYLKSCREEKIKNLNLSSSVNNLLCEQDDIWEQISELKSKLEKIDNEINETLVQEPDIVEAVFKYMIIHELPTDEIFNTMGLDAGSFHYIGDVVIKAVDEYGYSDVEGLTDEQFEELVNLIKEYNRKMFSIREALCNKILK